MAILKIARMGHPVLLQKCEPVADPGAPEIRRLGGAFLQNPKEITVAPPASVATTITQGLGLVTVHDKREALRRLIRKEDVQNALIFVSTCAYAGIALFLAFKTFQRESVLFRS